MPSLRLPLQYFNTTDMSVTEVASAVEIDNFGYFFRLFKREIGMSPREYKKMVNKPEYLAKYRISIYNIIRNIDIR
ncbi:MAG: helix-turn-helix domain-containing protein [Coprococcus sp.]